MSASSTTEILPEIQSLGFSEFKKTNLPHRYASIDFMRGIAIWLMLFLHTLMRVYDRGWVGNPEMANARLSLILFLVICVGFGGWCGFFLLISSIGNTISMQKQLNRGKSPKAVWKKQILGGGLLLLFAVLSESTIGYHGYLGNLVGNWQNWDNYSVILYRGFHMETIHAVAWCVIVNGSVQALMSRTAKNVGASDQERENIMTRHQWIYVGLAILVVAITPLVWKLADLVVSGYPFAHYPESGRIVQYPLEGISSFGDYIQLFFLMPFAGHPEPLFPFLSVSFFGSAIGLWLSKSHPKRALADLGMWVCAVVVVIGFIGLGVVMSQDLNKIGLFLGDTWNIPKLGDMWFWWFCVITGSQVFLVFLFLRMVEFRGKAVPFAQHTLYFRRFGLVAFSVYNFQFIDVVPRYLLSLIPGINVFSARAGGIASILAVVGVFLTWSLVFWVWEKGKYIGGMEWLIGSLSTFILNKSLSSSKNEKTTGKSTQKVITKGLNVDGILYHPRWINLRTPNQVNHLQSEDARLAFKIALFGLFVPGLAYFALSILLDARKNESHSKLWWVALGVSIFDFIVFLGGIVATSMISGIVL